MSRLLNALVIVSLCFAWVPVSSGADARLLAESRELSVEHEATMPSTLHSPLFTTPTDPLYPSQWGLAKIGAPSAWDVVVGTPSIAIAIVDTGVDVTHPDLAVQLWTNPGEAPGNGIDDDGNGYVDDVNGWNFVADTAEVNDDDGRGTRMAGVAAAETNNGQGIAGLCWNCRIMPVKVVQSGGVANYSDLATGIRYAADKGAKVIVIGTGGYADSPTLRDAIQYAATRSIIIAAAGDDNTDTPFYPAAYPDVLAVGGTTDTDTRASFSNYGAWVNVAAPAVAITTTLNGDGYGPASNTNLAASLTAGLAGLIWSEHSDWSPAMVKAQVIHTAEAIADTGLGSGRINAANAVTQSPHALLAVASTTINGDAFGRPTPGEAASLAVTLSNDWLDAAGISGTLTTADPSVTIVTGTASFANIASGDTGAGSPVYSFTVASGAGYNHPIPFTLSLTANAGAYTATLPLTITTVSADQSFCGTIAADQTWTSDKTYIINCNVGVAPGYTLTIQPGTVIKFNGVYTLGVGGTLIADGIQDQPIRFMSNITSTWGRIYFDNPSVDATSDVSGTYQGGNILRWARVESAGQGIGCNSATPYLSHVTLTGGGTNCTVGATTLWMQDSTLAGGLTVSGGGQIWRNTVTSGGVSLSGQATVRENTVSGGISAGSNSLVQGNAAGGTINASGASTVRNNTVSSGGVSVGSGSTVQENQMTGGNLSAGALSTVITNTVRSGGIAVGNGSLAQSNDVERATGWGISASGNVTLTHNRVVGNASGVNASSGLVQGNLIANSNGVGLQVGTATVVSNTLTGNKGNTLVIASGTPTITANNLELNTGTYDLVNNTANPISATLNWWGATDNGTIDTRVYDYFDDFNLGRLTYTPVLTGPVQDAPAYVRAITLTPASPIGVETVAFDVLFSKPMDTSSNPAMEFYTAKKGTWQTYNTSNSQLAHNDIRAILVDAANSKWIGADGGGVSVLHSDGSWQIYNTSNSGLAYDIVYGIAMDRVANKWFATYGGGVSVLYTDGTWQTYDTSNSGLPYNYVTAVALDSVGNKWFGTSGAGVCKLGIDGTWQTYNTSNSGLAGDSVNALMVDLTGAVWAGGGYWASVLKSNGTWQSYNSSNSGLAFGHVQDIVMDTAGNTWFAIWSGGVSVLRADGSWYNYNTSNSGLAENAVRAIAIDAAGNKWFGTGWYGVSELQADGTWQVYGQLGGKHVNKAAVDKTGNKWFGLWGWGGGVGVLWDAKYVIVDNPRWLASNFHHTSSEINGLIPRGDYVINAQNAVGIDGIQAAPNSNYTFTVDYIGMPETVTPPAPVVRACASSLTTTLSAQWSVPTTQTIGLYRYVIGTAPGQSDVTNWVTTTLTSITRANLNLLPGQTYYFSVKARNTGGIWSDVGSSNGVIAGAGGCPSVDFTAAPTSGMSPLAVAFTPQISGTVNSYLWSFGNGVTSTQASPVYTYTVPNAYTVTLDVFGPGGWSTTVRSSYILVTPDIVPPSGSVTINSGSAYVATTTVGLDIIASDPSGLNGMRLSNDGASYSAWVTYTPTYSWTLTSGDGQKTVYAQVRDVPGNIAMFTDTITLDTAPPQTSAVLSGTAGNNGWWRSAVSVTLVAFDAAAGVDQTDYRVDSGNCKRTQFHLPCLSPSGLFDSDPACLG